MQMHMFRAPMLTAALLFSSLLFGSDALAQCCPGGGGAPKAGSGLGETTPIATDLAVDAEWQVYEFERGGIRYMQINDSSGKVRAAVGRIDDVLWVMPIGTDVDRVSVDAAPAVSTPAKVLYRGTDVEVILRRTTNGDYWEVRRPHSSY
jgi:hypothetical protein